MEKTIRFRLWRSAILLVGCLWLPWLCHCGNESPSEPTELNNYPPAPSQIRRITLHSASGKNLDLALLGDTIAEFTPDEDANDTGVIEATSFMGRFGNPELSGKDPDTKDFTATVATANPIMLYRRGNRNTCWVQISGFHGRYKVNGALCDVVAYTLFLQITGTATDGSLLGTVTEIYTTDSSGHDTPVRHLGYETIAFQIDVDAAAPPLPVE